MSADNGIYILKTIRTWKEDGLGWVKTDPYPVYRVAMACAIDNFYHYEQNASYNLGAYMKDIWGCSPIFLSKEEALSYALNVEEEIPYLEYGISSIDTEYVFYGDL